MISTTMPLSTWRAVAGSLKAKQLIMEISVSTMLGNWGRSAQFSRISSARWDAYSCCSTGLAERTKLFPQSGQWSCLLALLNRAPQLSQTYTISITDFIISKLVFCFKR